MRRMSIGKIAQNCVCVRRLHIEGNRNMLNLILFVLACHVVVFALANAARIGDEQNALAWKNYCEEHGIPNAETYL